jgi:hypothetical protein
MLSLPKLGQKSVRASLRFGNVKPLLELLEQRL